MAKYRIDTDQGSYEVETDDSAAQGQVNPPPTGAFDRLKSALAPTMAVANQVYQMTPPGMMMKEADIAQKGLDTLGEKAATGLAQKFPNLPPQIPAAIGTGISMGPAVAAGAMGAEPVATDVAESMAPKAVEEAAPEAPGLLSGLKNKISQGIETLKGPSRSDAELLGKEMRESYTPAENIEKAKLVGQDIVSPEEAKVQYVEQQLKGLPETNAHKLDRLEELRQSAGGEMEAAEKEGGFHITPTSGFEQVAGSSEGMGKVLNVMGKWANMAPEEISNSVDPQTINLFRKLSKAGSGQLSQLGEITAQKGEVAAADALSQISDKFAESRSKYRDVMQAIEDLKDSQPLQAKAYQRQIAYLKVGLDKAQQDAQNLLQATRTANAQQLQDINARALDLLKQGIQHDALVNKIKLAAGAVGAGTAYKVFH